MKVPEHLKHKPIIAVNDYNELDGKYSPNTDAQSLSIGIAQYDDNEVSAKVFRLVNDRWSRQSEELPIHRVLDLTILIIASMKRKDSLNESISTFKENIIDNNHFDFMQSYFEKNAEHLLPRLNEIKRLLNL